MTTQNFDIIIIGAGPAGLSFANSLANSSLRIAIVDPASMNTLRTPKPDGREIALTHPSKHLLQKLGAWSNIPENEIFYLRSAKVMDGDSPFELHFKTPTKAQLTEDTLGYLVSNHHIREALFKQTEHQNNLTWFSEQKVKTVNANFEKAQVILSNDEQITANLVVAADSRFSQTRQQMGIPVDMHDFGRTVITCRIEHTSSNENTALEGFHYGHTLAILPLTNNLSSAVITLDSQKTHSVLSLDDDALAADLEKSLKGRLGKISIASPRYTYPLVGTHARQFYSTRFALIGDAAVGMHPVTAHGFNLGLQSQKILSELIQTAHAQKMDIGASSLLRSYNHRHQLKTRPIYHGTNFVVKLFTTEASPIKLIRTAVLRASQALSPVRKVISKQLTG